MDQWVGPAVTATIISSLIAVIGWFVAYGSARRMESIRRREKIRDFQVALLAEVRSERHHLARWDFEADLASVEQDYRDAELQHRAYVPMVPRSAGPILFQSLIPEIHLLPEQVIDPVMLYFRQQLLIERFIEDLRSDAFRSLDVARQIRMYSDYIEMMRYWKALADDAVAALSTSIAGKPSVSNAASGRSGPKSASAPAAAAASDRASSKSPHSNI